MDAVKPCDINIGEIHYIADRARGCRECDASRGVSRGASVVPTYPLQTDDDVQERVAATPEFVSALVRPVTPSALTRGDLYPHQELFKRLMMEYDRVLLLAEPGTGKTLSFFAVTEKLVRELGAYRRAYVFEKGNTLLENVRSQLIEKAAPRDVYESPRVVPGTYMRTLARIRSNAIAQHYSLDTYMRFANEVDEMTDGDVRERFSDCIFVLDEAHNIVKSDGRQTARYETFERIFSIAENIKVILSTATPMVNRVGELPPLMNLILPPERRFPAGWHYTPGDIERRCRGFVSYVGTVGAAARVVNMGEDRGGLVLVESEMERAQSDVYRRHAPPSRVSPDTNTGSIYINAFQSALFVWPDGSFGGSAQDGGFFKYVNAEDGVYHFRTVPRGFRASLVESRSRSFQEWLAPPSGSAAERVSRIRGLSCKFASILQTEIEEASGDGTTFVYTEGKFGGGAILLALCFEAFGFERYVPGGSRAPVGGLGRVALLTTEPEVTREQQRDILYTFNSPENAGGRIIKVIIGSLVSRDGLNLHHCVRVHLVSPPWTESGAKQAIARALRVVSHNDLLALRKRRAVERGVPAPSPTVSVRIYRHAAVSPPLPSIDRIGYSIAAAKEETITKAKAELVAGAIDAALTGCCSEASANNTQTSCVYTDSYWKSAAEVNMERAYFEAALLADGEARAPFVLRASDVEMPIVGRGRVVYPVLTTRGVVAGTLEAALRAAASRPSSCGALAGTPVFSIFHRTISDAVDNVVTRMLKLYMPPRGPPLNDLSFSTFPSQRAIVDFYERVLAGGGTRADRDLLERRYPEARYVRRTTAAAARAQAPHILPGVPGDAAVVVHLVYVEEKRLLQGEYSFSKAAMLSDNELVLDTLRHARVHVAGEGVGWRFAVIPQEVSIVQREKSDDNAPRPLLHGVTTGSKMKIVDRRRQAKSRGTVCETTNVFNIITDILALDPDLTDVASGLKPANDATYELYADDVESVFDVEKALVEGLDARRGDEAWRRRVAQLFNISRPILCTYLKRLFEMHGALYEE